MLFMFIFFNININYIGVQNKRRNAENCYFYRNSGGISSYDYISKLKKRLGNNAICDKPELQCMRMEIYEIYESQNTRMDWPNCADN